MRKRINTVLIFLVLFISILSANELKQKEKDIKLSGNFYWGEYSQSGKAEGEILDDAKINAKKDMIIKMQSFVAVSMTSSISEMDELVSENFQSDAKVFSKMQINDLEYLIIPKKKKFKVIAYISKDSYSKSINNFKNEIVEMIKIAEDIEKSKSITFAVKQYYLAYLKTFYSVEPIEYFSSITQKKYSSIQPYLKNKIESFLQECEIKIVKPQKDLKHNEIIKLPFDIKFQNDQVNDICISLDKKQYYKIIDGLATINLEKFPSNTKENYTVSSEIYFDELNDPKELLDIHKQYSIQKEKNIEIDFTDIIKIDYDFSVTKMKLSEKPIIKFTPQIAYLSPFHLEWSFGDDTFSTEINPTHQYQNGSEFEVSLTINKNQNLIVRKLINIFEGSQKGIVKTENQIINKLSKIRSYKELMNNLSSLKSEGKLIYGNQSDFKNPAECFVFIIDVQMGEIVAVLEKDVNGNRFDIFSQKQIPSLKIYKGKGAKWIKILEVSK